MKVRAVADVVPEYNPAKPEEMALSIDRKISLMRQNSVNPASDPKLSEGERAQYMEDAPASRPSYNSLGLEGHCASNGAGGGARTSGGGGRTTVEWLPYSSTKEKLASWKQPGATNDASNGRSLMKQFSKDERVA
jgi:hypothetical protein